MQAPEREKSPAHRPSADARWGRRSVAKSRVGVKLSQEKDTAMQNAKLATYVFAAVALGGPTSVCAAGRTEFTGFPIEYSTLPAETRAKIPVNESKEAFAVRLKSGGTIVLDGNTTTIGPIDFKNRTSAFIALDVLELRHGAKIITHGNVLTLFVNKIISEDGVIEAYDAQELKAAPGRNGSLPGAPGESGMPGNSGGVVAIHVIDGIEGILHVDLRGQEGGDGGLGAKGAPGAPGSKGEDAIDGRFDCRQHGRDGDRGDTGLIGGTGGAAGPGGQGGHLELVNVGPAPLPDADLAFQAIGGLPGRPGPGGQGGDGGPGGEGGHGSRSCDGGHGGPPGAQGPIGQNGAESIKGADGDVLRKNLDIETIIAQASSS